VVQLNGAANMRTSGIEYASDLISTFGTAFAAAVHHFSVPAFFDYPDTKAAMWRERSVRRVLDMQRRADIAVFSVGAVAGAVPSHVYSAGYLDDADVRNLHHVLQGLSHRGSGEARRQMVQALCDRAGLHDIRDPTAAMPRLRLRLDPGRSDAGRLET
jgi:hypothetical protein